MSYFKAKMHQIQFQTPLAELTALPQTPQLNLRGLLLRKGREGQGKGGEGKGREGIPWFLLTPPDVKSWIKR